MDFNIFFYSKESYFKDKCTYFVKLYKMCFEINKKIGKYIS